MAKAVATGLSTAAATRKPRAIAATAPSPKKVFHHVGGLYSTKML